MKIKEYLQKTCKAVNPFATSEGLKKGDMPDDQFDSEQLKMGIEIEKEHTDDPDIAKQIAKAHLAEIPDYYTKLKQMEDSAKKSEGVIPGIPDATGPRARQGTCPFTEEQENGLKQEVINFLKANPNPSDDELHNWAEGQGYDIPEIESIMYELATAHVMQHGGV